MLGIAFRNLLLAKRRTLLLGLAVALVAALFVTLRAVSGSIGERMIESATTLSAGHVNVAGFFKTRRRSSDPIVEGRTQLKDFVRQKVPEATSIIDRHRGWGRLVSPASSLNAGVNGIVFDDEARFFRSLRLAPEREYKKAGSDAVHGSFANLRQPNAVLLFAAQAKKLEVGVGDTVTLVTEASGGQSNTVDLQVAAIASDIGFMSNWNVFVLRQTVLDLYKLGPETTGVVMIYLPDPNRATTVMERLRKDLAASGFRILDHDPKAFFMKFDKVAGEDWLGQRLDLTVWSDEISFITWITQALDAVSFFVVFILAIIIVGGISNTMAMSVRERTKEIGTMRAIGTQRGFIAGVFLYEALMLGFLASAVGALLAATCLWAVSALALPITNDGVRMFLMANTFAAHARLLDIVVTLGLFSAITGLAALWPAVRASRLRPVEALLATK